MAYMGHWLHFSYGDMVEMDLKDFILFVQKTEDIAKSAENAS